MHNGLSTNADRLLTIVQATYEHISKPFLPTEESPSMTTINSPQHYTSLLRSAHQVANHLKNLSGFMWDDNKGLNIDVTTTNAWNEYVKVCTSFPHNWCCIDQHIEAFRCRSLQEKGLHALQTDGSFDAKSHQGYSCLPPITAVIWSCC